MHTNRNFDQELAHIDDCMVDATLFGTEKELAQLQQARIQVLGDWQKNAGI